MVAVACPVAVLLDESVTLICMTTDLMPFVNGAKAHDADGVFVLNPASVRGAGRVKAVHVKL
jgi:hypothetical protein